MPKQSGRVGAGGVAILVKALREQVTDRSQRTVAGPTGYSW